MFTPRSYDKYPKLWLLIVTKKWCSVKYLNILTKLSPIPSKRIVFHLPYMMGLIPGIGQIHSLTDRGGSHKGEQMNLGTKAQVSDVGEYVHPSADCVVGWTTLLSKPTRAVGATVTAGTVTLIGLPRMAR